MIKRAKLGVNLISVKLVIMSIAGEFKMQKHDFFHLAIRILDGNNRFRFLTLSA